MRRQHALFDGVAGFLGGVTGGAAAFPGAFVTIWCGFKGFSKERQRGIYQPFILIVQVAAVAVLAVSSSERRRAALRLRGNCLFAGHANRLLRLRYGVLQMAERPPVRPCRELPADRLGPEFPPVGALSGMLSAGSCSSYAPTRR